MFESGEEGCHPEQRSFHGHKLSTYIPPEQILLESLYNMNDSWEALELCKEGKAQFPAVQLCQNVLRSFKEQWYGKQSILRESGALK